MDPRERRQMNCRKLCIHHIRELTRKKYTIVTSIEVLHLLQKTYDGELVVEKINGVEKSITSDKSGCYCCLRTLHPYQKIIGLLKQKRFINVSDRVSEKIVADFEIYKESKHGAQEFLRHLLEGDGAGLPECYRDEFDLISARDWRYYSVWYKVSIPC